MFLLMLLATASAPAAPQAGRALGGACRFDAWSSDTDPAGLNVRSAPSASAPVVGRLPPPHYDADSERSFAVEFTVVEAKDGWFRIVGAYRYGYGKPGDKALPSGWISGRYVTFQLQTEKAFAAPDPRSDIVAHVRNDGGVYPFPYRQPSDCHGEWVKLRVTPKDGAERDGWVRGICANQETTCDGVQGDSDS